MSLDAQHVAVRLAGDVGLRHLFHEVVGLDRDAGDLLEHPAVAHLRVRRQQHPGAFHYGPDTKSLGRGRSERPTELSVGELRLDPATRRAWRGETEIELSAKEYSVLETFMRRPGQVLSRFQLLEHAWDYDYENRSNVVDAYIGFLRRKVDKPFGVASIETVRGAGYRLREDGGRAR